MSTKSLQKDKEMTLPEPIYNYHFLWDTLYHKDLAPAVTLTTRKTDYTICFNSASETCLF